MNKACVGFAPFLSETCLGFAPLGTPWGPQQECKENTCLNHATRDTAPEVVAAPDINQPGGPLGDASGERVAAVMTPAQGARAAHMPGGQARPQGDVRDLSDHLLTGLCHLDPGTPERSFIPGRAPARAHHPEAARAAGTGHGADAT